MITSVNTGVLLRVLGAALLTVAMLVTAGCGKTFSRDDFTKMVMNKSEADVVSSIGEPDWTDEKTSTSALWIYHRTTIDKEHEDKRDNQTRVIFGPDAATGKLKVIDVQFN